MATVKTLISGNNKLAIVVSHTWVTADESDVVIIDRSALTGPDGSTIPERIRIDEITWSISGGVMDVILDFDDATDEVIGIFQGQGYMDYRPIGGMNMAGAPTTATEGDVQLSTTGGGAGDYYNITLQCTLKT